MDHLIGQKFSLISKSEIRYVGTLHEINPEQSTIALEDVLSFGTEDRQVPKFIPPSPQKFEYIVFRGSDVKDIKINEEPEEPKRPSEPPNDPAILNSSRPGPARPPQGPQGLQEPQGPPSNRDESPFPPQNYPPQGYGGFYPPPPPPGQFGRGYGPPPGNFGPGPGYPPYGPPPGYFGPPGQGFPQGPNRFPPHQQPPPPIGPPGQRQPPQPQQQPPAPGLPDAAKQTPELPVEKNASRDGSKTSTPAPPTAPLQPPKPADPVPPTIPEVAPTPPAAKPPPTQPKGNRVTPAMPFAVNQRSFVPPPDPSQSAPKAAAKPAPSQAEMDEASRQAKAAVAAAMAKINAPGAAPPTTTAQPPATIEALTDQVSQLNTGPQASRGRGGYRGGRGQRSSSGGQRPKMEIPQSDFDFESSNAKFNKEDLIKEAIATGSPLTETQEDPLSAGGPQGQTNGDGRKDSLTNPPAPAYNKTSSFFDNISSEAKDREDHAEGRFDGRALRGQEFKKNIETFGQGNVDSGYRGRGRGGYRGRGRGDYNRGNNYRGGYRGRGRGVSNGADGLQN
ncbi:hypothetical protein PMZ80_009674 [Knufia obscura]|uniref:Uncharacterized protein n=1 Tax=Knufia obscura TaxID=1635080 RepID=A0ABR0RBT0_9EURO|nr:hypothetical protein PMZ80_009674 [Knufia obscura]